MLPEHNGQTKLANTPSQSFTHFSFFLETKITQIFDYKHRMAKPEPERYTFLNISKNVQRATYSTARSSPHCNWTRKAEHLTKEMKAFAALTLQWWRSRWQCSLFNERWIQSFKRNKKYVHSSDISQNIGINIFLTGRDPIPFSVSIKIHTVNLLRGHFWIPRLCDEEWLVLPLCKQWYSKYSSQNAFPWFPLEDSIMQTLTGRTGAYPGIGNLRRLS